jgi:transposase-like protein
MRRRKATVELFEQIRREYEFGIGTIQGVARQFGVHRRLVREAVQTAVPQQKVPPARARPRLEPVVRFIDAILDADRQAPRKQRHTAHRIYERLRQERPEHGIAESSVRRYVRERKAVLGLLTRETFVPQSYAWGSEAQVDWYEAYADLGDERVKLQVFALRSMARGAAFHGAYRHAIRQSHSSGEADPARLASRGDSAVRGVPLALAVRGGVLHAGGSP